MSMSYTPSRSVICLIDVVHAFVYREHLSKAACLVAILYSSLEIIERAKAARPSEHRRFKVKQDLLMYDRI